jgi:uncharacterized protein YjiS (DUF1127 family)
MDTTMSLVNFFLSAGRAVADWHRRQRAYEELMALNDHCLADLGIRRSEINAYLAAGRRDEIVPPAAAQQEAVRGQRKPA